MDRVVKLLSGYGWSRLADYDGDYRKPAFANGRWKCLVGKVWTTVWRLDGEGQIGPMTSYRTADSDRIETALQLVTG